ncbi:hypothetical protein [Streptomyces sp. NPDC048442]|uniref:hypothetical protein n=1 Tax=Streptomyces sp. NPDC048442 TaxID=3154823 RepID=UPI00343A922C
MTLLPLQPTPHLPRTAADTDGDTLFTRAHDLAQAGDFPAAAAFAALATAAFTAQAATLTAPPTIHLGDHEPQQVAWCRQCVTPNSRRTETGQPCPRCDTTRLRARPCRYCGINLERRPVEGPDSPWRWVDSHSNLSCPQAPDPLAAPAAPAPEEDVWPEQRWACFFSDWFSLYASAPLTTGQLVAETHLRTYLPRTTYGECHPAHLDSWFDLRCDSTCGKYTLRRAEDDAQSDAPRWYLQPSSDTADA